MPKQYSDACKREIILLFQNGMQISDINPNYGVALSTIYRWPEKYNAAGDMKAASNYQVLLHRKESLKHIVEII